MGVVLPAPFAGVPNKNNSVSIYRLKRGRGMGDCLFVFVCVGFFLMKADVKVFVSSLTIQSRDERHHPPQV